VEIGRAEHLKSTVVARQQAAASSKQPPPKDHEVVVEWLPGSDALVKRPHVTEAQKEMFGALHLQLLRSRSLWEKVLLVSVVVEARATGRSAVVMQVGFAPACQYSKAYFGRLT
jgi:quercetin dioxygenase-like cupin family protein